MTSYKNLPYFSSYLAGLLEGDGHIGLPSKSIRPYIAITFNQKESPLVEVFNKILGGSIRIKEKENAIVLILRSKQSIHFFILQVNGYLRTPKIYEFNQLVRWLNNKLSVSEQIPFKGVDISDLRSNAWFAGFLDADGGFKIRYQEKQINSETGKIVKKGRVAVIFVIEQRQYHPKTKESYLNIMESISKFFEIPNYAKSLRTSNHNQTSYWIVEVSSLLKLERLKNYLKRYPLLSSKKMDFEDWLKAYNLIQQGEHLKEEGRKVIKELKNGMNKKRQVFDWSFLDQVF